MTLTICSDLTAADWLVASDVDWWRLVTVGPDGYDAQARLRFIPDPEWEGQSENDVVIEEELPPEHALMAVAALLLEKHTSTPDDCYFAWWEGWPADLDSPRFPLPDPGGGLLVPYRAYHLLHGTVSDLGAWSEAAVWPEPRSAYPPAFVWPSDRAWCMARDVDPHFAGISASAAAIDDLLANRGLDVVRLEPGTEPPYYR